MQPCVPAVRSQDPFSKKDWYDIKAPGAFTVRNVGKTLVTRTAGTKVRQCPITRCGGLSMTQFWGAAI